MYKYNLTNITCNDGVLINPAEDVTPVLQSCNVWYHASWNICVENLKYSLMFDWVGNYLSRTPTVAGNRTTWTWSAWVKKLTTNASSHILFSQGTATDGFFIAVDNGLDAIDVANNNGGVNGLRKITAAVLRDPSAWYHVTVAIDTTNATATDRVRIYINGVRITSFQSTNIDPSQGYITNVNTATTHNIGRYISSANAYFDGYMSNISFVDWQALLPTDLWYTDSITWQRLPKKYAWNYWTNGFYLDFYDWTNLWKDTSWSTTNDWIVNWGITAANNQMLDHPTNNFATLNSLDKTGAALLSKGNSQWSVTWFSPSTTRSTFAISGKVYWEYKIVSLANGVNIGLSDSMNAASIAYTGPGIYSYSNAWITDYNGTAGTSLASYVAGDVIGVAYDSTTGKLWFSKNGIWLNSGDPAVWVGNVTTTVQSTISPWARVVGNPSVTDTLQINFGQWGQSGLTYYSTAGGSFKYAPPTGFKALSTANLPVPTILNPKQYFDVLTYAGNGAGQSISGLWFQPDLVWIKARGTASPSDHVLGDSVRGNDKSLYTDSTTAENTANEVISFLSNGFTIGYSNRVNTTSVPYVAWNWKAWWAAVANNSGTISSMVSANPTAWFSIVSYTSNGVAGATVGHGLNAQPKMIILKSRNNILDWYVGHTSYNGGINPWNYFTQLNQIVGQAASVNVWNNSAPNPQTFTVGSGFPSGWQIIAYVFSEVPGFSKFGSYIGNSSTDGPFVYTGFKPAFLLIKDITNSNGWFIYDLKRGIASPMNVPLQPNSSGAELSGYDIDATANGFKIRHVAGNNVSWDTYIYAAFAEVPFKYANAR